MIPETKPYRLETMSLDDLDEVAEIESACFSSPWPRSQFRASVVHPQVLPLTARDDERIRGYAILYFGTRRCLIANLAVRSEHRRAGVASRLIEESLEIARRRDSELVVLDVRPSNRAAIELYESFGFRAVRRKEGYYSSPPEDAVTMALALKKRSSNGPESRDDTR